MRLQLIGLLGLIALECSNPASTSMISPGALRSIMSHRGPRIVTLGPLTIAQNSLHGSFGACGDVASVPPKAATIGPPQVIEAKFRMDMHAPTTAGTIVSWQRFMTRLVLRGPVTPRVPTSILQQTDAEVYLSESAAADIEPIRDLSY